MANAQVFTAQRHHRTGTEAEAFRTQNRRFDDVEAGFQTAVHLQTDLVTQTVSHQRLLGFHQAKLPRAARVFHGGERACAGAAVIAGNGDQIRIGFRHAGGDGADARLGNQLHGDHRFRVDLLQVENELRQILDRVDIVVRRRGNQRHARHRVAQFGDVRGDFITRQLTAFARFCTLSDLNLDHVGVNQVGRGYAKAAGRHLLDARHFVGAVTGRIFTALAGVGVAADAVHGFRQRFVRFRAQRADGHRRGIEAFEQLGCRLNFVNADRFIARIEGNKIAQRRCRTVVHQLGILLIIAIFAALYRLLQRAHHVRVVGVIFAAVNVFQQAALFQRLTCQPGALRQVHQILLEVSKTGPADAADHALEAEVGDVVVQADRFKQLRAAVRGNGRDAHFGHDLVQAFVDAVTVVQHHRAVIFVDGAGVYQAGQRFVGQVWIDRRRTKA